MTHEVSFPKIPSLLIRAMRQNRRIIRCDACDPAILQLLGTFVANLFRSRRQLEVENLFLRISSILPCGVYRTICGFVGVTEHCWYA